MSASPAQSRRIAALVLAAATAFALAGCVPDPTPAPVPTGSGSPSPSSAPGAPDVEPTGAAAEPLEITCGELVDPNVVYAFNPTLALLGDWVPEPGTVAERAVASGGVACRWTFESGGGSMTLSVARLSEDEIRTLKNEAFQNSRMVPTYGEEAYFDVSGGVGEAIVFEGPHWLVVASEAFVEPGEPTEIIDAALAALAAR